MPHYHLWVKWAGRNNGAEREKIYPLLEAGGVSFVVTNYGFGAKSGEMNGGKGEKYMASRRRAGANEGLMESVGKDVIQWLTIDVMEEGGRGGFYCNLERSCVPLYSCTAAFDGISWRT